MTEPFWTSIVDALYEDIYRFSLRFLGSPEDARDATQEAFTKAFSALRGDEQLEAVRPMLYTIARNCCIDKTRWWRRWKKFLQGYEDPRENASDARIDWGPILELPTRQREVFILRHWHGFSTEETAKILAISEGAVKSHLKRAIERLKQTCLENEEE